MKILFSPSETKISGGNKAIFDLRNCIFPELSEKRKEIIEIYNYFVQNASRKEIEKLFGTKKDEMLERYSKDIFLSPIMKAVERYTGVAYDYIEYRGLPTSAQKYIDENMLIFSNLFGILKASDKIPDYKLKQGEGFASLKIENIYLDVFSNALDNYLQDEEILDLRAGFYEKFYTVKQPYTMLKFIKNGKIVSHFSKAYRGKFVRFLAENNIKKCDELLNTKIENLEVVNIQKQHHKTEIIYNITSSL